MMMWCDDDQLSISLSGLKWRLYHILWTILAYMALMDAVGWADMEFICERGVWVRMEGLFWVGAEECSWAVGGLGLCWRMDCRLLGMLKNVKIAIIENFVTSHIILKTSSFWAIATSIILKYISASYQYQLSVTHSFWIPFPFLTGNMPCPVYHSFIMRMISYPNTRPSREMIDNAKLVWLYKETEWKEMPKGVLGIGTFDCSETPKPMMVQKSA